MKRICRLVVLGVVGTSAMAIGADRPAPAAPPAPSAKADVVKREGTKVTISGVPEVQWGQTGTATLIGCLQAVTSVTEHPLDYADVQVWSGVAFRIRWYRGLKDNSWHGMSPVVEFPEEMAAISKASGWRMDVKNGRAPQFAAEICKSIDEGVCVLGYVNKSEFDVGFIYGYEDAGKKWLIDDYYLPARTVPGMEPHDFLIFLKWGKPELTPREALLQSLRTGIANWNRGEVPAEQIAQWAGPGTAKLCYGDSAYGQLILDIEQAGKLVGKEVDSLHHVRAWVCDNLAGSRDSAGKFLRRNSKLLGDAAEVHLLAAAGAFDQIGKKVGGALVSKQGFNFDGAWPPDMQQREIAILNECRILDEQGMGELQQALEKVEEQ